MACSKIKSSPVPVETVCLAAAAVSYFCAAENRVTAGSSTLSLICGALAIIAIFFIFRFTIKDRRLPALFPLLLLYMSAGPEMLELSGGHIAAILVSSALLITSRNKANGGNDTVSCVAALIIAASFVTPPIIWTLAVFFAYSCIKTRNVKNIPAVTAGIVITYTAAGCIIFLAEGAEATVEYASAYISGIADISFPAASFKGWRSVEDIILLAATIFTIVRYLIYRTRASAAEAAISGSLGILICSTLVLALFYGNRSGDLVILASSMSAFLLSALSVIEVERKASAITMYIIAAAAACAAVSEIYPEMNGVFPYLCNFITS